MRRMVYTWGAISFMLVVAGCSGGGKPAVATAPTEVAEDFEFDAARKQLTAGPVDEYQSFKWMVKAREALDSQGDPWDLRGNYPAALKWSGLAVEALGNRPYSGRVWQILADRVRVCNRALRPDLAAPTLSRLDELAGKVEEIEQLYVDILKLESGLLAARLPDGSLDRDWLQLMAADLLSKMEGIERQLERVRAPEQSRQYLFEAWQRLHIAWTGSHAALICADVARRGDKLTESERSVLERHLLQRIWYVSPDHYPEAAGVFYLRLYSFYVGANDGAKAQEAMGNARRLFRKTGSMLANARADLAQADAILAPGGSVETLGFTAAGSPYDPADDEWSRLLLPDPPSLWERRTGEVETLLVRADAVFRDAKNRRGLAATAVRRGYLAMKLERFDEAVEFYGQAEKVFGMAEDEPGRLTALLHLAVAQLLAQDVGAARKSANDLLAGLEKGSFRSLAWGFANAAAGFARKDLSIGATVNQRTAALNLAEKLAEFGARGKLRARLLASLATVASSLRLYDIAVRLSGTSIDLLAEVLDQTTEVEAKVRLNALRTDVALTAAGALLPSMVYRLEALRYAQLATEFVGKLENDESRTEEARRILFLANLESGQLTNAARLALPGDEGEAMAVAERRGRFKDVIGNAQKVLARTRRAYKEATAAAQGGDFTDPDALDDARSELAAGLHNLASLFIRSGEAKKRGKPTSKPPEFTKARVLADEWKALVSGEKDWESVAWEILGFYGRIAAGQNQTDGAWMFLSGALQSLEARREKLPHAQARATFTRMTLDVYEHLIEFLASQGDKSFEVPGRGTMSGAAASLALFEESRGYLREGVLTGEADYLHHLLKEPESGALRSLEQMVTSALREARFADESEAAVGHSGEEARKRLDTARTEQGRLRTALDVRFPGFALVRGAVSRFAPEAFVRMALEQQLSFVVFRLGTLYSLAWVVDAAGIRVRRLEVTEGRAEQLVASVKESMKPGQSDAFAGNAAEELYAGLFGPLEADLPAGQPILFVPDGALASLPPGILKKGKGYLIDRNPVGVIDSLALFGRLEGRDGTGPEAGLLIMSRPDNPTRGGRGELAALTTQRPMLLPPAAVSPPPETFVQWFEEDTMKYAAGVGATEFVFKKVAADYRVLHLATHVYQDGENPLQSGLVLAVAESPQDDGLLQAWELAGTKLTANVAVVLACDTGLSEPPGSEGISPIPMAFFGAGVPVVVATMLPVDPKGAVAFAESFYPALKQGLDVQRALQQSVKAIRAKPGLDHPRFWGGLTTYGLGTQKL